MPQTVIGGGYSYFRNNSGMVDRVEFFGGATFAVNENAGERNGVSLGNYININILGKLDKGFEGGWVFSEDGLFLHEYGHTFQSQRLGLSYLFAVGIPSGISAWLDEINGTHKHDNRWYELQANRWAWRYINKHFNISEWPYPYDNPLY